jgi:hypothetical protein
MSKTTHQETASDAPNASLDDHASGLTRRTVLAGAAVTTAAVAIGADAPAIAQGAKDDMGLFLKLSAALTGIAQDKLAPRVDPLPDFKMQYFKRASGMSDDSQGIKQDSKRATDFAVLLKIIRDANLPNPPPDGIIKQEDVDKLARQIVQAGDDVKYLARSIVLMWYVGSWYEPAELKRLATPNALPFASHEVISPAAYTSGWVWRVAQAHPMGYSDMQFGYWTHPPQPIDDFIKVRKPKGN